MQVALNIAYFGISVHTILHYDGFLPLVSACKSVWPPNVSACLCLARVLETFFI